MNEQRLIDLESKFSYQDHLIEELRQTTHEQYLAIEKLEKSVKALTDQLKNLHSDSPNKAHEKPPHY